MNSDFYCFFFGSSEKIFSSIEGAFCFFLTIVLFFLVSIFGFSELSSGIEAGAGYGPGLLQLDIFSI